MLKMSSQNDFFKALDGISKKNLRITYGITIKKAIAFKISNRFTNILQ